VKNIRILALPLLVLASSAVSVAQDTLFPRVLYLPQQHIRGNSVVQHTGSAFVIGGMAGTNPLITCLTNQGTVAWSRKYTFPGMGDKEITRILSLGDSCIGTLGSYVNDLLVMKTNGLGDTLWCGSVSYGELAEPGSLCETAGHGLLATATLESGSGLFMVGPDGDLAWSFRFPGLTIRSCVATGDTGFMVVGSNEDYNVVLITLLPDGTIARTLGKPPPGFGFEPLEILTEGSGLVMFGRFYPDNYYTFHRISADGLMTKAPGFFAPYAQEYPPPRLHRDGGSGFIVTFPGGWGSFLKLDSEPLFLWGREFWMDVTDAVPATGLTWFVLGNGPISSDILPNHMGVVEVSEAMISLCDDPEEFETETLEGSGYLQPLTFIPLPEGQYQRRHPEVSSLQLIGLGGCTEVYGAVPSAGSDPCSVTVTPNPFSLSTVITVEGAPPDAAFHAEITDFTGRVISRLPGSSGTVRIARGNLAPGLYLVHIRYAGGGLAGKVKLIVE
jgi:hypothetical protein